MITLNGRPTATLHNIKTGTRIEIKKKTVQRTTTKHHMAMKNRHVTLSQTTLHFCVKFPTCHSYKSIIHKPNKNSPIPKTAKSETSFKKNDTGKDKTHENEGRNLSETFCTLDHPRLHDGQEVAYPANWQLPGTITKNSLVTRCWYKERGRKEENKEKEGETTMAWVILRWKRDRGKKKRVRRRATDMVKWRNRID